MSANSFSIRGKTILLAEDNIENQELIVNILEILGCQLDIASDGFETVEKWSQKKYDLIIMDIQMPRMDGFQAAIEIRKLEKGERHTLILALTASVLADDRQKCVDVGMDGYLSKPITFELLEKKLYELFSSSSPLNQPLPEKTS